MITIRTNLPKEKVTPAFRLRMARQLSKFLPNGCMPYPISDPDGAYVFDEHNDWWCTVNDDDSKIIHICYRDFDKQPQKERAFAEWVTQWRGWEILKSRRTACTVIQDVALTIEFPRKLDADDLSSITFDLPMSSIGVYVDTKLVPGARVTGYCTHEFGEFLEGEPA